MAFSRRTHIVRISDARPGDPPSDTFIDIEVLDAISFRVENNKEVVINIAAQRSEPWIVDDTGGNHDKQPARPTQRTHMKRIVNPKDPTQKLDVEVMDCAAFRDQNNDEWILDMQPGSGDDAEVFNVSDNSGDNKSTRRVHNETITNPPGRTKTEAGNQYLTSVRSDNIAFRRVGRREVIISTPSSDDKHAAGVGFGRAPTFIVTPTGYDPAKDDPKPQTLLESGDQHNYVSFVKDAAGFFTGDAKIAMGPFWWIRKISGPSSYIVIAVTARNNSPNSIPPLPTIDLTSGAGENDANGQPQGAILDETSIPKTTSDTTSGKFFIIWSDELPFPTSDNYNTIISSNSPFGPIGYASQFGMGPIQMGTVPGGATQIFGEPPDVGVLHPFFPGADAGTYNGPQQSYTIHGPPDATVEYYFEYTYFAGGQPSFGPQLFPGIQQPVNGPYYAKPSFADLAEANQAAAAFTAYWTQQNGLLTIPASFTQMTNADGTPHIISGFPPAVHGAELDVSNETSGVATLQQYWLLRMPSAETKLSVSVSTNNLGSASISVYTYEPDGEEHIATLNDVVVPGLNTDQNGNALNVNAVGFDEEQDAGPRRGSILWTVTTSKTPEGTLDVEIDG